MRIQHNIMAMNAYRNYNNNTSALSKNLEKLSSGYRINRAGDDAAGLAISEKMRAQITGLETAQKNAKDGISLVQTAEGALTEVHSMLNRMTELATQSANGTFDDSTDRAQLQKEVAQLQEEIDRIADSANFNGLKLLDGSMDAEGMSGGRPANISFSALTASQQGVSAAPPSFKIDLSGINFDKTVTGSSGLTFKISIGGAELEVKSNKNGVGTVAASELQVTATNIVVGGLTYAISATNGTNITFTMVTSSTAGTNNAAAIANGTAILNPALDVKISGAITGGSQTGHIINKGTQVIQVGRKAQAEQAAQANFKVGLDMLQNGAKIKLGDQVLTIDYAGTHSTGAGNTIGVKDLLDENGNLTTDKIQTVVSRITEKAQSNADFVVGHNGDELTLTSKAAAASKVNTTAKLKDMIQVTTLAKPGNGLVLQIGDTSDSFNQLNVSIQDMHADKLGIHDVDIGTQAGAKAAIDKIKNAINTVSSVRGTLGATQNRLDHTMNNLSVMTENIQDAEATIRDTDVADEMMAYTKNNILIQSAQAMLAQANQVPQGVLQLLQ